ncbi:hypothetical protein PY38_00185, partial [Staphylococcus aureus]
PGTGGGYGVDGHRGDAGVRSGDHTGMHGTGTGFYQVCGGGVIGDGYRGVRRNFLLTGFAHVSVGVDRGDIHRGIGVRGQDQLRCWATQCWQRDHGFPADGSGGRLVGGVDCGGVAGGVVIICCRVEGQRGGRGQNIGIRFNGDRIG